MEGEPVTIRIFTSPEMLLRLPPSFSQHRQKNSGGHVRCRFGQNVVNIPVGTGYERVPQGEIWLSSHAAHRLGVPRGEDTIRGLWSNELLLGPLIGVLCNPRWLSDKRTLRANPQLPSLVKLCEAGEKWGATVFLFRLVDIDFERQRVTGYRYIGTGWEKKKYPLPAVVYDQLLSRKLERSEAYIKLRARLHPLYGSAWFNDGFLDKWTVHDWLYKDPELRRYLPEAERHNRVQQAAQFVLRHQSVFLKPLHGSLGRGIIHLSRGPDGSVMVEQKQTKGVLRTRVRSSNDAVKGLAKRIGRRPYIWQQGISLLTYDGRPFDLRILMQKDHTGQWKRTKMFARIARMGDYTSNLSAGGEALSVNDVLSTLNERKELKSRIRQSLRTVSMLVVEALDKQSGKSFGEAGVDLGVDLQGNVWVIEVNSKPRKAPATEKGRQDLVDLSFDRPIRYAIRLATMPHD